MELVLGDGVRYVQAGDLESTCLLLLISQKHHTFSFSKMCRATLVLDVKESSAWRNPWCKGKVALGHYSVWPPQFWVGYHNSAEKQTEMFGGFGRDSSRETSIAASSSGLTFPFCFLWGWTECPKSLQSVAKDPGWLQEAPTAMA